MMGMWSRAVEPILMTAKIVVCAVLFLIHVWPHRNSVPQTGTKRFLPTCSNPVEAWLSTYQLILARIKDEH
jgi:hypothetical protein